MKIEVRLRLEQLYRTHTVARIKKAFILRLSDKVFSTIARAAIGQKDAGKLDNARLVWLGYEIAVDSRYLENQYR